MSEAQVVTAEMNVGDVNVQVLRQQLAQLQQENAALRSQLSRPDARPVANAFEGFKQQSRERRAQRDLFGGLVRAARALIRKASEVEGAVEDRVVATAEMVLNDDARDAALKVVLDAAKYVPARAASEVAAAGADVVVGGAAHVSSEIARVVAVAEAAANKSADQSVVAAAGRLLADAVKKNFAGLAVESFNAARDIRNGLGNSVQGVRRENNLNTPPEDIQGMASAPYEYKSAQVREKAGVLIYELLNGVKQVDIVAVVEQTPTTLRSALVAELAREGVLISDHLLQGDKYMLGYLRRDVRLETAKLRESRSSARTSPELETAIAALRDATQRYDEKLKRIQGSRELMSIDTIRRAVAHAYDFSMN